MRSPSLFASFRFALAGLKHAFLSERNVRIHFSAAIFVFTAAFLLRVSNIEWVILIILIGGMITLELFNTAIERVVDLVSPTRQLLAKQAKDVAAGAVLIYAFASAIIGLVIFFPKIIALF